MTFRTLRSFSSSSCAGVFVVFSSMVRSYHKLFRGRGNELVVAVVTLAVTTAGFGLVALHAQRRLLRVPVVAVVVPPQAAAPREHLVLLARHLVLLGVARPRLVARGGPDEPRGCLVAGANDDVVVVDPHRGLPRKAPRGEAGLQRRAVELLVGTVVDTEGDTEGTRAPPALARQPHPNELREQVVELGRRFDVGPRLAPICQGVRVHEEADLERVVARLDEAAPGGGANRLTGGERPPPGRGVGRVDGFSEVHLIHVANRIA